MLNSIKDFRNDYASRYGSGAGKFLSDFGVTLIEEVEKALAHPKSTIYIFGNGGSYAISKCLGYVIQEYATRRSSAIRIEHGVDINRASELDEKEVSGISFIETLKRQGGDTNDLVILISGSGNSDNLCEVAAFAKASSIPLLAMIGSRNGKLIDFIPASRCFITPIEDQQISEDIIQSVTFGFELDLYHISPETRLDRIGELCSELERAIRDFPVEMMDSLAEKVVDSFLAPSPLWVLGVGHPSLNVCAEHTAHNLYWDGIYEVSDPPQRLIVSSPTAANLSGIANDRRDRVLSHLMGFKESKNGCVVIYAAKIDHMLEKMLDEIEASGISSYLICTTGELIDKGKRKLTHKTKILSDHVQSAICQIFGHVMGRIVRMKLLEKVDGVKFDGTDHVTEFLTNNDLAQRRFLNEQKG